ncbi:hypothetical protein Bca4012_074094 [Brassica carinata]
MKKSLIFSFNVLTFLIILTLVAGAMGNIGQGRTNKRVWCPIYLDNQKPCSCLNKHGCLSACKTKIGGTQEVRTSCFSGNKCTCQARCP